MKDKRLLAPMLLAMFSVTVATGCATPHAAAVDCEGHLMPINGSSVVPGAPLASAGEGAAGGDRHG